MRSSRFLAVTVTVAAATLSLLEIGTSAGAQASGGSHLPPPGGVPHRVCAAPAQGNAACDAIVLTYNKPSKTHRTTTTTTSSTTTTTTSSTTTTTTSSTTTSSTSSTTSTTAASTTTTTLAGGTCAFKTATPGGYGPCDLQSAYKLYTPSSTLGAGRTVAIVDAYDDPSAASDLNTYRAQFGLPSVNFTKINQNGVAGSYPSANGGWAQEISLDLDMVSAICPECSILLVEANSATFTDLGTAENTAAAWPGVVAISNSWGGSESSGETSQDSTFDHPGIAITASAGDSGYGVEYPAASRYVTAVGGTTLTKASTTRGWSETVWSGTGSGCSAYEPQMSWQANLGSCLNRTVGDVAADANPNTGVAVYDSYAYQGLSGWLVFGGTSVASPIVASVYALSGNTTSTGASYAYSHASSLFDVTSGSNGSCGGSYLCTGEVGYDGPTGLGTPNGTGAF